MKSHLELEENDLTHQIQQYKNKSITINNVNYYNSIIVQEQQEITTWPIQDIKQITADIIKKITLNKHTILIIGTGASHKMLDINLIAKTGIKIECMSTKAACSTYTILAQESRAVIAALII